jgi:poly(A) polymerase
VTIIPRSEHPISRKNIDPDALKVLYRLRQFNHVAYLVGGSVRDMLLDRTPKDFDIGTSAHPYEVKRLFRNCWIIGRRFRLAHVKFGTKIIEVATFRKQIPAGTEEEPLAQVPSAAPTALEAFNVEPFKDEDVDRLIHHDNTFGTPEEDAFRRDFTLNALFYDIETHAIIDYVGGLEDIRARVIRCIGNPDERFQEDPVRMFRAAALASRLDFTIDEPVLESIARQHGELARSAPPRLMEEIYKVMRAGAAEKTFRSLVITGLLAAIAPEVPGRITAAFWQSLAAVDAHRRSAKPGEALPNALLLGSLLLPLGLLDQHHGRTKELGARFGMLPLARRDVEYLRQILTIQRQLRDLDAPQRHKRSLMHRSSFAGALAWLDLHGNVPHIVTMWKALQAEHALDTGLPPGDAEPRRRRRRRRRRGGGGGGGTFQVKTGS